jgi:hypothetical protein
MRHVKLFEQFTSERYQFNVTEIGRNTGVKLNLKKITKILKKAGYPATIEKEGILPSNEDGVITRDKLSVRADYGYIKICRNGEIFGSDNWGIEITSEDEVIPALKRFLQDQELLYKKTNR